MSDGLILHNENPALDRYERIDANAIKELAANGYFENGFSPACVAILPFVKPHHVGLEIGVFRGASSTVFLDRCAFMFLVDPCLSYAGNPDKEYFTPEKAVLDLLKPYGFRFKFIKGFSADVADQVPGDLDFVFVDGNHELEYVREDIRLYWPKVKSGGFMSGHDYTGGHPGVTHAVDEFAAANNLTVEQHQYCWLIHKP